MPYAFTYKKIKLPIGKDRRVKIDEAGRADIRYRHKQGQAIRSIARDYPNISRRTIQLIIYPERAELAKKYLKQWQAKNGNYLQRYGRKKWAEVKREHERYKQKTLKNEAIQ